MIYFVEAVGVGHIKIGFTDQFDAELRVANLQTGSPVALRLLGTILGTLEAEKDLHRRFASSRVHGEWFKPTPELLQLIGSPEPLQCDGAEVIERSVQIRVMTVGRKQFGKALLDQLPRGNPFNHDFTLKDGCVYWGWLDTASGNRFEIIYEHSVALYRCLVVGINAPCALLPARSEFTDKGEFRNRHLPFFNRGAEINAAWARVRHLWLGEAHHLYFKV